MTWADTYDHSNNTDTVYAKPRPHSADPSWGADVVAAVDNDDDDRQKSFASLDDGMQYSVLKQTGASPAVTDPVLAIMSADTVTAINADATQTTARTNAATAATQATAAAASAATSATEIVKIPRSAEAVTAGAALYKKLVDSDGETLRTVAEVVVGDSDIAIVEEEI